MHFSRFCHPGAHQDSNSTTKPATWYAFSGIGHSQRENLPTRTRQWVVIDSKVYDLTKFKDMHPGGVSVLLQADVGVYHLPTQCLSDA